MSNIIFKYSLLLLSIVFVYIFSSGIILISGKFNSNNDHLSQLEAQLNQLKETKSNDELELKYRNSIDYYIKKSINDGYLLTQGKIININDLTDTAKEKEKLQIPYKTLEVVKPTVFEQWLRVLLN